MNANLQQLQTRRADWLRVLARATADELDRAAAARRREHAFEWLRQPEQGLVMVRARIANTGDRYNLGEATVTRCALRLSREQRDRQARAAAEASRVRFFTLQAEAA